MEDDINDWQWHIWNLDDTPLDLVDNILNGQNWHWQQVMIYMKFGNSCQIFVRNEWIHWNFLIVYFFSVFSCLFLTLSVLNIFLKFYRRILVGIVYYCFCYNFKNIFSSRIVSDWIAKPNVFSKLQICLFKPMIDFR